MPYSDWLTGFSTWARSCWPKKDVAKGLRMAESRFDILRRMQDLHPSDLIIIPHMPTDEEVTLALVSGAYGWDDRHFGSTEFGADFGHFVAVDPNSLRTFHIDSSPETATIASKYQNYRSAVNMVRNPRYQEVAWRLYHSDPRKGLR